MEALALSASENKLKKQEKEKTHSQPGLGLDLGRAAATVGKLDLRRGSSIHSRIWPPWWSLSPPKEEIHAAHLAKIQMRQICTRKGREGARWIRPRSAAAGVASSTGSPDPPREREGGGSPSDLHGGGVAPV